MAREVEVALLRTRTSGTLVDFGLLELARGELDRAVEALEEAVELAPAEPAARLELAAALLARDRERRDLSDAARAYELVASETVSEPRARTLLAAALEALSLGPRVVARRESTVRSWADLREGARAAVERDDLADLERLRASAPTLFRRAAERSLLEEWSRAALARRESERREVEVLLLALGELFSRHGDRWFERLAAELAATPEEDRRRLGGFTAQLVAWRGRVASGRLDGAVARLDALRSELDPLHTALAALAVEGAADAVIQAGRHRDGGARLADLLRRATDLASGGLTARHHWLAGYAAGNAGRAFAARRHLVEALSGYTLLGEIESSGFVELLLSTNALRRGDEPTAWHHLGQALSTLSSGRDENRLAIARLAAGHECAIRGWHRSALVLHAAAAEADRRSGNPYFLATSLWAEGELAQRAGDRVRLERSLSELAPILEQISSAELRRQVAAGVGLLVARDGRRPWVERWARAEESVATFRAAGSGSRHLEALLVRSELLALAGRRDEAAADLDHVLDALGEEARAGLTADEATLLLERARDSADAAVRLALESGAAPEETLRESDRLRWRLQPILENAREAEEGAPTLSAGVAAASFWLLPEATVVWTLLPNGQTTVDRTSIGRPAIEALVRRLRRAVARDDAREIEQIERSLHSALMSAPRSRASAVTRWVIVPDGVLWGLPFGRLRDATTGRALVEEVELTSVPFLAGLRDSPAQRAGSRGPVVVVGDPEFRSVDHPGLSRLPRSALEAREIAALHSGARLLERDQATPTATLAESRHAGLLHVAAHALTEASRPLASRLVLAPASADDDGLLAGSEILAATLEGHPLVVLSACSAGRGYLGRLPGTIGLGQAFLGAGARHVVAALEDLEDEAARGFFVALHHHLARGVDPTTALTLTQRAALADPGQRRVALAVQSIRIDRAALSPPVQLEEP